MDAIMRIEMFGGLSIYWGDKCLAERSTRPGKPQELLALLLVRASEKMSNEQLMDALWEMDETENPAGALKNAAYQLRKFLQKADPRTPFIIMEGGRYAWNEAVPLQLDIREFETTVQRVFAHGTPENTQVELARRALALYAGDLLPGLDGRQWVIQHNSYLRQMYLRTVKHLAGLLETRGRRADLEEVLTICNRATLLEPLQEELYWHTFSAMRGLDMKQAVLSYYPVISNLFYDELGEKLSPELRDIYLWASEGSNQIKEDLCQVQQDLSEVTRNARPICGAYYCEYEMFKHVYHMVARSAERSGNHVIIMLITIASDDGKPMPKQVTVETMLMLKDLIKNTLRKGDVFSRYSRNQYILMLPVNKAEDYEIVQQRLQSSYDKSCKNRSIHIDMKAQTLEPIV